MELFIKQRTFLIVLCVILFLGVLIFYYSKDVALESFSKLPPTIQENVNMGIPFYISKYDKNSTDTVERYSTEKTSIGNLPGPSIKDQQDGKQRCAILCNAQPECSNPDHKCTSSYDATDVRARKGCSCQFQQIQNDDAEPFQSNMILSKEAFTTTSDNKSILDRINNTYMSTVKPLFEPFETSIEDIFNQDVIPKWSIPETHVENNSAYLVNSYRRFDWNIDLKTVDEYTFSFWVTLDVSPLPTNVFLHAGNDLLIALHGNGNFSITQNADGLTRNKDDSCSSTNCRKITVFYSIPWITDAENGSIDPKQFHLSLTNSHGTIKLYLNGEYMDSSYVDRPHYNYLGYGGFGPKTVPDNKVGINTRGESGLYINNVLYHSKALPNTDIATLARTPPTRP